jgi:hypothetical protein
MRKFKKVTLLFLLSVLPFLQTIKAQQIEVKATIDSTNILIGQQTLIKLEVIQPKDAKVNFPYFNPEDTLTANVEILAISKADTSKADKDKIIIRQNYLITSFDSGSYVIPPFKFQLIDQDYQTNSLILNVDNIQIKEGEEIKDIKPVYDPPFNWLLLIVIILLVLLALAFIGVGIYFYILRKKNKPIPFFEKQKIILPPHEVALQKLTRIKDEKIWQKGQDKLYYTQLTDVLREYFTKRFNIQAMEMTSGEIMEALQTNEEAKPILDKLQQILSISDMVKFAKRQPTSEESEISIISAFFVVNQTKIVINDEVMSDKSAPLITHNS